MSKSKNGIGSNLKEPKRELVDKSDENKVIIPLAAGAAIGTYILPGVGTVIGTAIGGLVGLLRDEKEEKISRIPVFYSFHYSNDVMRVQQIRNIGAIEGNSPTNPNEWETLKRTGDKAVEGWIEKNMKYKRCIVVLIGSETANRPWVKHEIIKAWNDGKAILGIHIHNIKCPRDGKSRKGKSPFDSITFKSGKKLSDYIPSYDPDIENAYGDIAKNISTWIDQAISKKAN